MNPLPLKTLWKLTLSEEKHSGKTANHVAIAMVIVHSLSSGKVEMLLCAACHAFTPHVNASKR